MPHPSAEFTLAYIDQASFLGLRALGRGPLAQFTWVYEHPVDLNGLRRFHRDLAYGLLGRLVERSVLPFGRHHWVALPHPAEMAITTSTLPRAAVPAWSEDQIRQPVDPEWGPPWRLAVAPIEGGGAAVTLVASHTLCDGLGMSLAIADAAKGIRCDLGYPPPNARTLAQALREDAGRALRAIPEMLTAAAAAIRVARANAAQVSSSAARATPPASLSDSQPVIPPSLAVYLDAAEWDACAEKLSGTSNSLFAGIAARLGRNIGRVDTDGRAELSIPVSERIEGDTRGNALTAMLVKVDPGEVTTTLVGVRAEIKRNLAELARTPRDLLAPLPLTPLVPRRLARRLEGLALGSGVTIGCSNLGELDPAVNRPDGTDADYLSARQIESRITADVLDRMGGMLFLASGRVHGRVFLTVSAWRVGGPNGREALAEQAAGVLAEFGMRGRIE